MQLTLLSSVLLALSASVFSAPVEVSLATRSGPGKRGLCWPFYNSPLNPAKFKDSSNSVNLIYDYETFAPPSSNGAGGLNFIGMQRCLDCQSSPISQLQARQKQLKFSTLFTLNEPDINGISPQTAAAWYKQNINPLAIKKALPAVTSSTNPGQGLDWLQQMVAACNGQCFFDYINIHHYGPNLQAFKDFVNKAHAQFPGKQIVVTEFALQNPAGGQAAQVAFFRDAFKFLDGASFVAMYFPFVATTPALFAKNDANGAKFVGTGSTLFNNDGSVSAVGKLMLA
ncbi:Glyco-hydro-cc domain-containing protein [Mycena indigotica]|uniref:Glyco-hydro-cc domain-containing protein n=1 Tax=Mycena indigotica TaxID=2126181 RepID=A0A8H6SGV3_9AGAR|nr:Glyco-hydro-cc domain-containing protein [Mycena indigotica]KAF7299323.1 Glyco-hydro-cc domain-containing protein [Mycena indigotica]